MRRLSWRLGWVALVLVVAQSASSAAVVLVSQTRAIGARAEVGGLVGSPSFSKTASGFEAFDEEVTAAVRGPGDTQDSVSRVTQRSTLSDDGFSISGLYEFQNHGEFADGASFARVVFDVTDSQRYALNYDLQAGSTTNLGPNNAIATVELRRVSPVVASIVGPESVTSQPEFNTALESSAEFSGSGVLDAGRYELFLRVGGLDFDQPGSATSDSSNATVSYSVSLDFTGNGNGGGPNPIPLPPGAWAGGAMLGGIMFGRLRKMLCAAR